MTDFLQAVRERFVVYDGAMGTNIQARGRGEGTFSRNSLRDLT
jgi:methionine synthase I (cobalamin-dependent)